jgi:hypothetical protein
MSHQLRSLITYLGRARLHPAHHCRHVKNRINNTPRLCLIPNLFSISYPIILSPRYLEPHNLSTYSDTSLEMHSPVEIDTPLETYPATEMGDSSDVWRQPTSFQFLKLPFEIRVMIWRVSLHPRIIQPVLPKKYGGFRARVELPVALRVCRESRAAVDKMYVHCFGSILKPPHIRVNFEPDAVFLSRNLSDDMELFLGF